MPGGTLYSRSENVSVQKRSLPDLVCPLFHPLSSFPSPLGLDFPFMINRFSDEGVSSGTEVRQSMKGLSSSVTSCLCFSSLIH
jgi:hypothetical protein